MKQKRGMITLQGYLFALDTIQAALACPDYDVRACCSPHWHKKEWYRSGKQRYYCAICERLNAWIRYYEHGNKTA